MMFEIDFLHRSFCDECGTSLET